jgi:membrane associated rhomboid family serine protease
VRRPPPVPFIVLCARFGLSGVDRISACDVVGTSNATKEIADMREGTREPIFNIPRVVLLLLAAMTLVHAARMALAPETDLQLVALYGFTPARFAFLFDQRAVLDHLTEVSRASEIEGEIGQFFLTYGSQRNLWITPLSYAFLHGNWTHLALNGVWFAAFGSPVARRFGTGRFLLLGALGAIGGAFFYLVLHLTELAPMVGASAAISAYTGAAARFVFQPGVFFGDAPNPYGQSQEAPPMAALREMLANSQTLAFVGFWFAINLLSGVGGQSVGFSNAPVAWEAHIGGFLVGILLAPLFDQRRKA